MRRHHALGLAGGARGEEDVGEVGGCDGRCAPLGFRRREASAGLEKIRPRERAGGRAPHEDDALEIGQLGDRTRAGRAAAGAAQQVDVAVAEKLLDRDRECARRSWRECSRPRRPSCGCSKVRARRPPSADRSPRPPTRRCSVPRSRPGRRPEYRRRRTRAPPAIPPSASVCEGERDVAVLDGVAVAEARGGIADERGEGLRGGHRGRSTPRSAVSAIARLDAIGSRAAPAAAPVADSFLTGRLRAG